MSFLSPAAALLAAAVTIPLLVALYLLKLRRRRLRIASTFLWMGSHADLQVNVPFQRLRLSGLFVVQLLALAALLVALAEPVISTGEPVSERLVLLVDHSASMQAADATGRTRLERAREMAGEIVRRRLGRGDGAEVMVIAVGARPQVVSGFDARRDVLVAAIDAIRPTDETADLAAALGLAGTFTGGAEDADDAPTDVVLVSDGGVRPPGSDAGFALRHGRFRLLPVTGDDDPVENVGITAVTARRAHADPADVLVFVRLAATYASPDVLVRLSVDGEPGPMKRVTFAPARRDAISAGSAPPGAAPLHEGTVTFAVRLEGGAVIGVRHQASDALPRDDTAAVVLPPPARPRIAIVHAAAGPDPNLATLLAETGPARLAYSSEARYRAGDLAGGDVAEAFDVLVFDRVAPPALPEVPSIWFGAAPDAIEATPPSSPGGQRIMSWRREHPLLRHVALDTIVYTGAGPLLLPPEATDLVSGPDGPIMALLRDGPLEHVVVGFSLAESNWPTHVSVAVFMQNVLDRLTASRSGRDSIGHRPGEPIEVRAGPDVGVITVRGPAGATFTVPVPEERLRPGGTPVTLPALVQAGLYAVDGAMPPGDRVAVSVLSPVETDIRPRDEIFVNAARVRAGAVRSIVPRSVWAWFAAAALGLVVMEWLLYCRLLRV